MNLPLDAVSERIIQREIGRGHYATHAEVVVANSLSQLEDQELWLSVDKEALDARLEESLAQIERGEGMTGDQLRAFLTGAERLRQGSSLHRLVERGAQYGGDTALLMALRHG